MGAFIMRRLLTVALGLNLPAPNAGAQMYYPRGYGGYGMSQWGAFGPIRAEPCPVELRLDRPESALAGLHSHLPTGRTQAPR
jgi:hypothetical protein